MTPQPSTLAKIRRMRQFGFTVEATARDCGVTQEVVRRHDCRTPFNIADRERRERRRLLASGADPAAVAANF